ncbi:MAG: SMP-30/gluconolactonase/LRE family protein [Chloroflexota bacterium]
MIRKIFLSLVGIGMLVILAALLRPSPIDAVSLDLPEPPAATAVLASNNLLQQAKRLAPGEIVHPEDIAFDDEGRLYTGSSNGRIYRISFHEDNSVANVEEFAETGGYPLGLHFDQQGNLIAAVKDIGLVAIDANGAVTVLTNATAGVPIIYADELDIASDGVIYFSDASTKYTWGWPYDFLEGRPNGRFLAYYPDTGETAVLHDNLYFANGVVLAPDESYVLVGETAVARIMRFWLKGEQAGTMEIFAENLPNSPDNISVDENGRYWVAGNLRSSQLETLHQYPFIKNQLAKLPFSFLRNMPQNEALRYGFVLVLDENGQPIASLHDETGHIYSVSSAQPYGEHLYLGTLFGDAIGRLPLTDLIDE